MRRILFVLGTRPEAVKLGPVIRHFRSRPAEFAVEVCATGQHRELVEPVLRLFSAEADYRLSTMRAGQALGPSMGRIIKALDDVMRRSSPELVVVQGDTTSTFAGALAAFYARVPVAHVEAGLRTGDSGNPFPEESHRVLTSRLAALHFAATPGAAANLRREGVPAERVAITGNTGVDAVLHVRKELLAGRLTAPPRPWLDPAKKLVLATVHRRESFGADLAQVCAALRRIAGRGDARIVVPVHPNPAVRGPLRRHLKGVEGIVLLGPQDYPGFVDLMSRAYLILTDSGGIQEEAPALGVPALVLRDETERPEAIEAGVARLVGKRAEAICREAFRLLDDPRERDRRAAGRNPFGDGAASRRVADSTLDFFDPARRLAAAV